MRRGVILMHAVLLARMLSTPALALEAPIALGVDSNWASIDDFGVGARLVVGLDDRRNVEVVGGYVWYLPITSAETERFVWEASAGLAYGFSTGDEGVRPYLGAGVHVSHVREERETEEMDMRFGHGLSGFFLETRVEIGGGENMVFTVGLRF
jgi:outer membrane protein W